MPVPFAGGCACGAIRYECSAEPIVALNCYCRDCQRCSGGGCTTALVVPAPALKLLRGVPQGHVVQADSGSEVQREFCPECGSPLFAGSPTTPEVRVIKVGSLDDPSWVSPAADIYTASAHPWSFMNPDLPKFSKMPPQPES